MAKIGVVGIGWWACFNHIPTLQASADVDKIAICDLDTTRLATVGDQFNITARYSDVTEMVRAEKLDGVIISTPHIAHTKPALAALAAGAHVLVEKPVTVTVAASAASRPPFTTPGRGRRRSGSDPTFPHTFSAFWLRSSVVSVLISIIADSGLIETHAIILISRGGQVSWGCSGPCRA